MATSQPQSTISWNTPEFLAEKLQLLYSEHMIQSYQYIFHLGEDGDQNHFHVRIVPNKRLDMMEIASFFKEPDLVKPDMPPLGTLDWGFSKQDDWLLYAIHEPRYMKLKYKDDKGEKIPYKMEDIVTSAGFPLEQSMLRAYAAMEHMSPNVLTALEQGADPRELVKSGENVALVRQLMQICYQYKNHREFERLERQYQNEAKKRFALEDKLLELGFFCSYDKEGNVSFNPVDIE